MSKAFASAATLASLLMATLCATAQADGTLPSSADTLAAPAPLVKAVSQQLEQEHPEKLKLFGPKVLALATAGGARVWLMPLQEKAGEYCTFLSVNDADKSNQELASFVGCKIKGVKFGDVNGDGLTDALYSVKVKSNQHDAWVDEEVLMLMKADKTGFCKSEQGPRFTRDPHSLRCQ